MVAVFICVVGPDAVAWAELPRVPPADLSKLKPSDFRDSELAIPYYLAHFHRLANSIEESGVNRGFITLRVWRPPEHNHPYNARVMENHLAFAFFYSTDRKWNPYYQHPAVRKRLEAVLDFWARIQNSDGRFSEYGPRKWNLAATGFSTMFMAKTLELLHDGPPIDREIHLRVIAAQKKAITALLANDSLYNDGKRFSNQYSTLWGAILTFLRRYPDAELEARMRQRLIQTLKDHRSPAGYWYERDGCDWSYTLHVHNGNFQIAWPYVRGTDLEDHFIQRETPWIEWLAYNAVREPDGNAFVLNMGINTRTKQGFFSNWVTPLAEKIPLARAFASTEAEASQATARKRQELEKNWPKILALKIPSGNSYVPHHFLTLYDPRAHPTKTQRNAAVKKLPYLAYEEFNHQRVDDRHPQTYTFVKRKSYYAAFNTGKNLSRANQQRFGLGLLWNPQSGSVLQSQSDSGHASWGTVGGGEKTVYETELANASFTVAGKPLHPVVGPTDLPHGELTVTYPLGKDGWKTVTFAENHIAVSVEHKGAFTEYLPLLTGLGDELELHRGKVELHRGDTTLTITFDPAAKATTKETEYRVASKRVVALSIDASVALTYRLSFASKSQF